MKHHKRRLAAAITGCLTLLSPTVLFSSESASSDGASSAHRVALKFSSLPIVAQALCPTDLINGRMSLTATAGTVMPGTKFDVTTPYELAILGEKLSFSRDGGANFVGYKSNAPTKVPSFRDGMIDIPVGPAKKGGAISIPVVTDTKEGYTAYYRSGSVAVGSVGKDRVFIYDNNLNGSYAIGEDMFSVGSGVVFASLGKWLPTTDGLMNVISIKEDGSSFEYAKSTVASGKLDVRFVNPLALSHVVLTGPDGASVIACGGKPVVTLPGEYRISHGLLMDAKTGNAFAGIIPGKSSLITVVAGEVAKGVFGGPFTGDFKASISQAAADKPKMLTIDWPPIYNLRGANGEEYVDFRLKGGFADVFINGKPSGMVTHPC
jgi:hypothetical protein